jgi:hypothetical protein
LQIPSFYGVPQSVKVKPPKRRDRKNHIGIIIQQAGHLQYTNDNSDHDHNNKINPSYFAQTAFKK